MKLRLYLSCLILIAFISCKKTTKTEAKPEQDTNEPTQSFKDEHNSQNSLDWSGVYTGIIPCADCEGIQTRIELQSDLTYQKSIKYLGKSQEFYSSEGKFNWDEAGNSIQFQNEDPPNSYKVVENALMVLDIKDQEIEGDLKSKYRLEKDNSAEE